jgi:hypothetical protein
VPFQGLGASWPAGRSYWDVSQFRAPYNQGYYQNNDLRGLGEATAPAPGACADGSGNWLPLPKPDGGVQMICPSSPYWKKAVYYHYLLKLRHLESMGAVPASLAKAIDQNAPPDVKRFLLAGEPVPTTARDMTLPFNQVPRWAYGVLAVAAAGVSYASYKRFKKRTGAPANG